MLLDKFRDRYSFNFLSICGWANFILFCICALPELYVIYIIGNTEHNFGVGISFLGLSFFTILFCLVAFFIYVFEIVSWKRITNEKFLNNRYIKICQTLGIIFAFLPIILVVIFYTYSFLQDGIYKILGID